MALPKRIFITSLLVFSLFYALKSEASFSRILRRGDRGEDVLQLQQVLNKDPETQVAAQGLGSLGQETHYFGYMTYLAVKKFQQKYSSEILTPIGYTMPTGMIGPRTIAKLNDLLGQDSGGVNPSSYSQGIGVVVPVLPENTKPTIVSISPKIINTNPYEIIISGNNFTDSDNTVMIPSEKQFGFTGISSADGKTIKIKIPFSLSERVKKQISSFPSSVDIDSFITEFTKNLIGPAVVRYNNTTYIRVVISVKNSKGESNQSYVDVDIGALLRN